MQQAGCIDFKNARELFDHVDCRAVNSSFERTNVGPINVRLQRQSFLRQPSRLTSRPQIARKNIPQTHRSERTFLLSKQLRSILYIQPHAAEWGEHTWVFER